MYNGTPVKQWKFEDDDKIAIYFTLDKVPEETKYLYLATGTFSETKKCIKLEDELFDGLNKDKKMALLVRKHGNIKSKLRFDPSEDTYRLYKPSNGLWDPIEETAAVFFVAKVIGEIVQPMYHLQNFRELTDSRFNRKRPVVYPKSTAVKNLLSQYAEKMRAAKDILNAIKAKITFKFDSNMYPSFLLFQNGLVNLETGKLQGAASPDMGMIHVVPHNYDPDIDTTQIHQKMMSFWPEQVYPAESDNIARFYQGFKGYSLTGHTNLQKALFLLGRGSNGKSVLNSLDLAAWGNDLFKNIGMSAFSQEGSGNNDYLYQIKSTRAATIMENSNSGRINEETFKKTTGGDPLSVSAKYKKGVTEKFPTKLIFSTNDPPVFSSANSYAIKRRIWNLHMLAQRLAPDDEQRVKLASEGKSNYIMDLDTKFLTDLIANHIPAYIRWCVEGAVAYFANNQNIIVPKTVMRASSPISASERMDLFISFINEFFIRADSKSIISTSEIRETFLIKEEMTTDIDAKVEDELNKLLKLILTDPRTRTNTFANCKVIRTVFPSRPSKSSKGTESPKERETTAYRKTMGYSGKKNNSLLLLCCLCVLVYTDDILFLCRNCLASRDHRPNRERYQNPIHKRKASNDFISSTGC